MTANGRLLELACAKIADLSVPACIKDCELRHVAVNEAYARYYGREPGDFVGRTSLDISPRPEEADREERERRTLVFGEDAVALCYDQTGTLRHPARIERFVTEDDHPYLFAMFDEHGTAEVAGSVGSPALSFSAESGASAFEAFRALLQELPAATFVRGDDNRMILANRAYCELLGLDGDALIGKTEIESFGPAGEPLHRENRRILETGMPVEIEELVSNGAGRRVPVISRRRRVTGADGKYYLLGSVTDISSLKRREMQYIGAQKEANELHAHLQSLLKSMPVGVLILDADFNIEYVNDAFYAMWPVDQHTDVIGWSYRDFVGYNHGHGLYGENAPSADEIYDLRLAQLKAPEEPPVWEWHVPGCRTLAVHCRRLESSRFLITYSDITALRQREEESQLYQSALEQLPVPVFLRDEERRLVFANAAYVEMHGTERERLLGMTEADMFPGRADDFRRENEEVLRDGVALEKTETFEFEGRQITAITRLGRIVTSKEQRYIVGSITDVSALKERERELTEAQARAEKLYDDLLSVFRIMPVGVAILDADLNVEFANEQCATIWAWPEGTPLDGKPFRYYCELNRKKGWSWPEVDFDEGYRQRVAVFAQLQGSVTRDLLYADGKYVLSTATRLNDNRILLTYADLTEMRKKEREIDEAKAELEQLGQLMQDAVRVMSQGLAVVEDGVIIRSNEALGRIFDVPKAALEAGQSWHVCFAHCAKRGDFGSDPMAVLSEWQAKVAAGQGFSTTFLANGKTWVRIEATVGARGHWMMVATDITEIKSREQELTVLLARAEAADKAKSEFLANMSHEIRTPMNGVLGMAELLSKSMLDTRQKTFVDIIVKSGNALLTIINDILDFSKIDAGQMMLRKAPFDPVEAIEDVASLLSASASEKDIELIVRADASIHHILVGDAGRFRQILTNLLGNAIKFTEKGHVLIALSGERNSTDQMMLTMRIEDTGIGIPEAKLKSIFEKFSQVDASSTRRHEGTGLGLAITSGLVNLFGGSIAVESEVGHGSAFVVSLPFTIASERSRTVPLPVMVQDARVLVVDDNAVNRQILTEQLASWGFDGVAVEDGLTGLAVLDAATRAGVRVDALVIDYHMPEMNGIEFARRVRADRRFDAVSMIFLTSMDIVGDEQLFEELRVQAHLMKPARANLLRSAIVDVVRDARLRQVGDRAAISQARAPSEPTRMPPLARPAGTGRLDILVAEDNEVNQIVFTQILETTGLSFRIVTDGRQAVEAWEASQPRLILMDVSMPVMNGHQATRAIRQKEMDAGASAHVPVIGVTAHALDTDRDLCLAAGMDDYMSKPISPELLARKVERWLGPISGTKAASGSVF